jgi:hypothetical protein
MRIWRLTNSDGIQQSKSKLIFSVLNKSLFREKSFTLNYALLGCDVVTWRILNPQDHDILRFHHVTVKVKLSLCLVKHHAMMTRGSTDIALRILNLGFRWKWVVSVTLRPLCIPKKNPWFRLDRRLFGPHSRSGHIIYISEIRHSCEEERTFNCPTAEFTSAINRLNIGRNDIYIKDIKECICKIHVPKSRVGKPFSSCSYLCY